MISHWQFVENVVAALESFSNAGLPGLKVTPKAMIPMRLAPTVLREVDVLVEFRAGTRTMRIGVDVKAESKPLDIVSVESLWGKSQNLDLDRFSVVSLSGYTANAKATYEPRGIELLTMKQVEQFPWAAGLTFAVVHRTCEFTSICMRYDGQHRRPSQRVLDRAATWTAREGMGQTYTLTAYLARKLGETIPVPVGAPPSGSTTFADLAVGLEPGLRTLLTIRAGKLPVQIPNSLTLSGRLLWETREYSAAHFRSDSADELVSVALDLPGWRDGQAQLTLRALRSGEDVSGVSLILNPANPRRARSQG